MIGIRIGENRKPESRWGRNLPSGEYDLFVRTKRVAKGWTRHDNHVDERYMGVGKTVVTSENLLHITILPDFPDQ
jgi:hypothetical protein